MNKLAGCASFLLVLFVPCLFGSVIEKQYAFPKPSIEPVRLTVEKGRAPERFDRILLPGCPSTAEPGAPVLPRWPVKLLLPQGHGVKRIEVIAGRPKRLPGRYRLPPSQRAFPLHGSAAFEPTPMDSKIYESPGVYPGRIRTEPVTQWCRGFGLVFFELFPIRYAPMDGAVYYLERMTVRVHTESAPAPKGVVGRRNNAADRNWVQARVQNPELAAGYKAGPFPPPQSFPEQIYEYVVITNQQLASDPGPDNFQALMAHREKRGLRCFLKTVEDIYAEFEGADEAAKIRNFCIHAYENFGIEYVLLGGDGDASGLGRIVPARGFYATGEGYSENDLKADLYYANLDGDFDFNKNQLFGELGDGPGGGEVDLLGELFVGRAPVASTDELHRFVAKVIAYETSNHTLPWYTHGLFVGEFLWANPNTWGGDYMDELIDGSGLWGYVTAGFPEDWTKATLYERNSSWNASHLASLLNSDGVHLVNHAGHANTNYVMKFGVADVDALTNTLPFFVYSQGCLSGNFSVQECMAERFVTAEHGAFAVVMNDKYGWGEVGCTDGSSQYFHREFVDALFREGLREAGKANADSKEDNIWSVNYKSNRWCLYETNLFGDPATPLCGPLAGSLGTLSLNRSAYKDGATVKVVVQDMDLNQNPKARETATVSFTGAGGDQEDLLLKEWGPDSPRFHGQILLIDGTPKPGSHVLEMSHGETFTLVYLDEDNGFGQTNVPVIGQADADFMAPLLSGVQVTFVDDDEAVVEWDADEPVQGTIVCGMAPPLDLVVEGHELSSHPSIRVEGLVQCSDYEFFVKAADAAGNKAKEDNGGINYAFATLQRFYALDERMNVDPQWSISGGLWQWGPPQGLCGDPAVGYTGPSVYGYNLAGPYENGMPARHLTTPPLDCSKLEGTTLVFQRLLTMNGSKKDLARLAISSNGSNWTKLYENPISPYIEPCWLEWTYDISSMADKEKTVYLRWTMGPTDSHGQQGGWNIDDVQVFGVAAPSQPWLEHESHDVDDAAGGNGDGFINPGEVVTLPVTLRNTGLDALAPTAKLSSYTNGVVLLDDQADLPDIAHNEMGETLSPHFLIQTDLGLKDGEELLFGLDWTAGGASGTAYFSHEVSSADMAFKEAWADDSAFDNDGIIDPGETVELAVEVENLGSADALNLEGRLTCNMPQYVTLIDDTAFFGDVPPQGAAVSQAPHFLVSFSSATPNFTKVEFTLILWGDNYSGETHFLKEVTVTNLKYAWHFDVDPGWTCQKKWEFGVPAGQWPDYGCPDPDSGYTGSNVYGYNLEGGYSGLELKAYRLTSKPIDCSGCQHVKVRFMRWLGVAGNDGARFQISSDGATWIDVWDHGNDEVSDGEWVPVDYDISAWADNQPFLYLRWTMGPFAAVKSYCGWNIDDVEIWCK